MSFLSWIGGIIAEGSIKDGPDVTRMKAMRKMSGPVQRTRNALIDNVFRDQVKPVVGSVVCCDLAPIPLDALTGMTADHTGIYVGYNKIAHRDGEGFLKIVSTNEFLSRLGGFNAAMSIYVSCKGENPVGVKEAAQRARLAIDDPQHGGYNLVLKNCHQFTQYCVTGHIDNGLTDFMFSTLEDTLHSEWGMDNWRVWNLPTEAIHQI